MTLAAATIAFRARAAARALEPLAAAGTRHRRRLWAQRPAAPRPRHRASAGQRRRAARSAPDLLERDGRAGDHRESCCARASRATASARAALRAAAAAAAVPLGMGCYLSFSRGALAALAAGLLALVVARRAERRASCAPARSWLGAGARRRRSPRPRRRRSAPAPARWPRASARARSCSRSRSSSSRRRGAPPPACRRPIGPLALPPWLGLGGRGGDRRPARRPHRRRAAASAGAAGHRRHQPALQLPGLQPLRLLARGDRHRRRPPAARAWAPAASRRVAAPAPRSTRPCATRTRSSSRRSPSSGSSASRCSPRCWAASG